VENRKEGVPAAQWFDQTNEQFDSTNVAVSKFILELRILTIYILTHLRSTFNSIKRSTISFVIYTALTTFFDAWTSPVGYLRTQRS